MLGTGVKDLSVLLFINTTSSNPARQALPPFYKQGELESLVPGQEPWVPSAFQVPKNERRLNNRGSASAIRYRTAHTGRGSDGRRIR